MLNRVSYHSVLIGLKNTTRALKKKFQCGCFHYQFFYCLEVMKKQLLCCFLHFEIVLLLANTKNTLILEKVSYSPFHYCLFYS